MFAPAPTLVALLVVVASAESLQAQQDGATHTVYTDGESFSPDFISIEAGDTVVWTVPGGQAHNVSASNGEFHSENLVNGETFSFTFVTPGEYSYLCGIHPSTMTGIVIVGARQQAPVAPTRPPSVPTAAVATVVSPTSLPTAASATATSVATTTPAVPTVTSTSPSDGASPHATATTAELSAKPVPGDENRRPAGLVVAAVIAALAVAAFGAVRFVGKRR